LSPPDRNVPLYERIHFNPTLEVLALRRLAEQDVEGCRSALAMLL
jgi:hypothetical protein